MAQRAGGQAVTLGEAYGLGPEWAEIAALPYTRPAGWAWSRVAHWPVRALLWRLSTCDAAAAYALGYDAAVGGLLPALELGLEAAFDGREAARAAWLSGVAAGSAEA